MHVKGRESETPKISSHDWKKHRFNSSKPENMLVKCEGLPQWGSLSAIWNCKQNYRLWRSDKRSITSEVALPLQLQYLSTLQISHVWIPECCSLLLGTRVKHIKETLSFLQLQPQWSQAPTKNLNFMYQLISMVTILLSRYWDKYNALSKTLCHMTILTHPHRHQNPP